MTQADWITQQSISTEKGLMDYYLHHMRMTTVPPYKGSMAKLAAISVARLNELFAQRDGTPPADSPQLEVQHA